MRELSGVIKSIRFASEKTGYTVCDVKCDAGMLTMVGIMPLLVVGENIIARGDYVYHADYGRQFKVEACERKIPTREEEIRDYLSSGIIKGLGPATAEKLVEAFGEETFKVLQFEPYRLCEIKGITPDKALAFGQAFLEHESMRGVVMLMQRFGVSSQMAAKIWRKFGRTAEDEIRQNPYSLTDGSIGLEFRVCDRIAMALGHDPYSKERIKSAVLHILAASIADGHTYTPKSELMKEAARLTRVPEEHIEDAFDALRLENRIFVEKQHPDRVYTDAMMQAERYLASRLESLNIKKPGHIFHDVDDQLSQIEAAQSVTLDEIQKEAVRCAVRSGICIITGGPGTGKTTVIRTLIRIFENKGLSVVLAAPTGRAAKRISETSGCEAKTLHRLLEVGYSIEDEDRPYFMRNEENPLTSDVYIVDEASMVDILMMQALLKALPEEARLILVGDVDQLPPVGPGRVLNDLIDSGVFSVVKLETIFRQSEESLIIPNAHRINHGLMPELNREEGDFYFIQKLGAAEAASAIVELITRKIPERFGFDPSRDIQVLSPMRKGETGIQNLNHILQESMNPEEEGKAQKISGGIIYRVGDRVIQNRNDYSLPWTFPDGKGSWVEGQGVYNGDMGSIADIDLKAEILTVRFDDQRTCEYRFDMLENLEHAFAITVHKSQGSEFPAVVIPLFGVPFALVYRNLLYTAVTRAKKLVVLVGSPTILEQMVRNVNKKERHSGLKERLRHGTGNS